MLTVVAKKLFARQTLRLLSWEFEIFVISEYISASKGIKASYTSLQ